MAYEFKGYQKFLALVVVLGLVIYWWRGRPAPLPYNQFDPDGSIRRHLNETEESNKQLRDLQEQARRANEPLNR